LSRPKCAFLRPDGSRCGSSPLPESGLCFFHDPAVAKEAAEARRLGGLRRRREGSVAGAYEFVGLDSVEAIRRLLVIASLDTLALDNSLARSRTLVQLAMAATRLLETGELETRLERLQESVSRMETGDTSVFDDAIQEAEYRFIGPEPLPNEVVAQDEEADEPRETEEDDQ
jgi:hypothetical protein